MIHYPNHIDNLVVDASGIFPNEADDYHHYFQVVCSCSANHFYLFFGTKRSVHAICQQCLRNVTIYDLAEYPAATKSKGMETFELHSGINGPTKIFVEYEYGQLDEGDEFDRDDISWCQVFIEIQGEIRKVFDDETS